MAYQRKSSSLTLEALAGRVIFWQWQSRLAVAIDATLLIRKPIVLESNQDLRNPLYLATLLRLTEDGGVQPAMKQAVRRQ